MLIAPDALAVLAGALLIDALVGDPDWLWRRWPHPVGWFGRLIAFGDRRLNRARWPGSTRRIAGAAWLFVMVAATAGAALGLEAALRALPFGSAFVALAASCLLAQKSLHQHVARVRDAFADGLPAARGAVSMIVGRETDRLDEAAVCRAAIESGAENFSDGVVAPALWFAIGGLAGLAAYKLVNTADSMIGHLSDRHRDFGWAAARLDDGLNLLPARLSAILLALAAPAGGGRTGSALRAAWRDAGLHRSPNAGWPEAAMAGALDLALGGPRVYAAGPVDAPLLHADGRRDASPSDITRALRVLATASLLHGIGWAAAALAAG